MTWAHRHLDVARRPSPDGLLDLTVFSDALGRRVDVTLFRAEDERSVEDDLPVLLLLHGVYCSHWSWARSGDAHGTLRELVSAGESAPFVLAMPSDGMWGVGSGYLDRVGEDAERWVVAELPSLVRRVWPQASEARVAVAGLSMGGWGALRLAARHPGRFFAASGMSPLTHVDQVAGYAEDDQRHTYTSTAVQSPALIDALAGAGELPPLRITCGTDDELVLSVRELHADLVARGIDHEYAERPGGHEWDVWSSELADTLRFVTAHLPTATQ